MRRPFGPLRAFLSPFHPLYGNIVCLTAQRPKESTLLVLLLRHGDGAISALEMPLCTDSILVLTAKYWLPATSAEGH